MELLPLWFEAELGYDEFWEKTIGEIVYILKEKQKVADLKAKQQLIFNYNMAAMTSSFIGYMLNGKQIPSIEEVMPDVMDNKAIQKAQEQQQKQRMSMYVDQMRAFAAAHNSQTKKVKDK